MLIHIGDGVCKKTERGERRLVERGFERERQGRNKKREGGSRGTGEGAEGSGG